MSHTKFPGTTLNFEEGVGDGDEVKYAMPKVSVQFTGLPKELREFVIIWVIGSILGVSKAVDMKFTRKHDICRLQVLVLDPQYHTPVRGCGDRGLSLRSPIQS